MYHLPAGDADINAVRGRMISWHRSSGIGINFYK